MIESGGYPMGAEFDSDAPYNQEEPKVEDRSFELAVNYSIGRVAPVDLPCYASGPNEGLTEYANPIERFEEAYVTPGELFAVLQTFLLQAIKETDNEEIKKRYKWYLDELQCWSIEDKDYDIL